MSNNVNIINKVEKDLDVIDLLSLKPGDIFIIDNIEYIVLEQLSDNQTAIIRRKPLKENIIFGINNDWKQSHIRSFLNGEYLNKIVQVFGKYRIVEHKVDLLSLNGLDDYGTSIDNVSLLTIDQYRKYKKMGVKFEENLNDCWWLLTPDRPTKSSHGEILCVDFDGILFSMNCISYINIRPFFIIQS